MGHLSGVGAVELDDVRRLRVYRDKDAVLFVRRDRAVELNALAFQNRNKKLFLSFQRSLWIKGRHHRKSRNLLVRPWRERAKNYLWGRDKYLL